VTSLKTSHINFIAPINLKKEEKETPKQGFSLESFSE
jgi:hypothetical protein